LNEPFPKVPGDLQRAGQKNNFLQAEQAGLFDEKIEQDGFRIEEPCSPAISGTENALAVAVQYQTGGLRS